MNTNYFYIRADLSIFVSLNSLFDNSNTWYVCGSILWSYCWIPVFCTKLYNTYWWINTLRFIYIYQCYWDHIKTKGASRMQTKFYKFSIMYFGLIEVQQNQRIHKVRNTVIYATTSNVTQCYSINLKMILVMIEFV